MTLAEIDALTLEDTWQILLSKMITFSAPLDGDKYWWLDEDDQIPFYDRIMLDTSLTKPTEQELSDELDAYKIDLTAIENERLRREDWHNRFEAINDKRAVLNDMNLQPTNAKIWARDIIDSKDETLLLAMEAQAVITASNQAQYKSDEDTKDQEALDSILQLKALDWATITSNAKLKQVVKHLTKIMYKQLK